MCTASGSSGCCRTRHTPWSGRRNRTRILRDGSIVIVWNAITAAVLRAQLSLRPHFDENQGAITAPLVRAAPDPAPGTPSHGLSAGLAGTALQSPSPTPRPTRTPGPLPWHICVTVTVAVTVTGTRRAGVTVGLSSRRLPVTRLPTGNRAADGSVSDYLP
jgi:hypothetical protein